MPGREKIIEEMSLLRDFLLGEERKAFKGNNDSAVKVLMHYRNVVIDALALLKEQEARLMTLEEVKAFDWDYCYLEEERLPGKGYRAVCGDYALTCITWPCVTSMRIQHGDDSYGKKWRCWSAKPTDEQKKAVKWK